MRIGFVGTGNMGSPIARRLMEEGHQLTVHDLRREATTYLCEMGALWADSPRAAAQAPGDEHVVVFTSLPGPTEVEKVALDPDYRHPGRTQAGQRLHRPDHQLALHVPQGSRGLPRSRRRGIGCPGEWPPS